MKRLIWLMSRFNVSPELIGNIAEDAPHHSTFWPLRQSTSAILEALRSGLLHDKFRTLCAVVLGEIVWQVVPEVLIAFGVQNAVLLPLFVAWPFVTGWAIARVQHDQPLGATLLFITTQLMCAAIYVANSVEAAQRMYPASSRPIWLAIYQSVVLGSILLCTFLGALTVRPRSRAAV